MKQKVNMKPLKMNLQYFSEAGSANAGAEAGANDNSENRQENPGEQNQEPKTYTQAEFDKLLQSESDKRVAQALKTFKEKDLPGLINGAKSEAEKLAKMNAEQKAEFERQQREEDYNRRNTEVTRRELRIEAHKTLTEKKLPVELLEVLNYTDADTCNSSLEAVEKAFRTALEVAVNDRLKGEPPKAPTPGEKSLQAQIEAQLGLKN